MSSATGYCDSTTVFAGAEGGALRLSENTVRPKVARLLAQSGGGEIRTHGRLAPSTVFKTVPLDRSGTPPEVIVTG